MITPRRTRLVRVPDLPAFREAIERLANPEPRTLNPEPGTLNPRVVLVPTRSAARQLQRAAGDAVLVTRDELYAHLHARLTAPPRLLSAVERDVLMHAAARQAAAGGELSFRLRPGLVVELLRFYDHLRRQQQTVTRFEELIGEAVGGAGDDRAAVRLRRQTGFLADAFRDYERRVTETGGADEHALRARLIAETATNPVRHVVVTMPDWIADAAGLFVADFDLLTRVPGLESLDIVSTEAVLRSGFHERLHDWWPGLDEIVGAELAPPEGPPRSAPAVESGRAGSAPTVQTPPGAPPDEPWWTHRDREEELVAIVRQLKTDEHHGNAVPLARTAVVFKHPLPYLYLAAEVFGAADVPYQASDALPLAAEPTAAALDLVFDAVAANFTRDTIVALLRSPHFSFQHEGAGIPRDVTSALDRALSEARYLGDLDRLQAILDERRGGVPEAAGVLDAVRPLALLATPHAASAQVGRVIDFWSRHARPIADDDPFAPRERRARAAIVDTLKAMAAAQAAYDDPTWTIDDLAAAARRWIGEQTFAPDAARGGGVHLLDDQAVRYGEFDDITIVGVIEQEWPERPRRNIFYPPSLLKALGWPSEKDRRAAADARFVDLLSSASRRTYAFTFTLDEDALVSRSTQLDQIPRARVSSVASMPPGDDAGSRVFVDEALSLEPVMLDPLDDVARGWAQMRIGRTPADAMDFHGTVRGGMEVPGHTVQKLPSPAHAWSVSALETYLDCPFKFFAQRVLRLEEEPDDDEVMDPRRQGQFVHDVFEQFFAAWTRAGHRAITPANLDAARDLFTTIVDAALAAAHLSAAEAGLERTRLLGSPAAAGLGEAIFRMEAERPLAVVDRLLEHPLNGDFTFVTAGGPRTVALKGKADRIDLLEDGTFRVIDYKLGWPPQRGRALQLPIYGLCAQQQLTTERGRTWTLGEAAYIAFKGPRRVVPLFSAGDREKTLADAQQRMADTLDAIARGEFPPAPDDVYRCETCSFASVCRKDYVGDV
ncbi:MAG: PD-(D/E)XK nuclease family protein [Acidobacteria bacterium]|nr:PD-(D/E)XK nuclease family protein [Acidobacteriota bacterium]